MGRRSIAALVLFFYSISCLGCTHPLSIKNISMYQPEFINSTKKSFSIGLLTDTGLSVEGRLATAIANNLKKNGVSVVYPYYPNNPNTDTGSEVDYVANINFSEEYKGSGMNFLVNFPGFLIFAPVLFGYGYTVKFDYNIDMTHQASGESFPRLNIPIELKVRHAASNRTWTEISWFEFGVIALIGGVVFVQYDDSVTDIILDKYENKLGDYVASKITRMVINTN